GAGGDLGALDTDRLHEQPHPVTFLDCHLSPVPVCISSQCVIIRGSSWRRRTARQTLTSRRGRSVRSPWRGRCAVGRTSSRCVPRSVRAVAVRVVAAGRRRGVLSPVGERVAELLPCLSLALVVRIFEASPSVRRRGGVPDA